MSKAPSPLLGYNNNVRHKNRVFHIQTEDSGVKYGHIITHLFMDGGRILKSVKTSYAEYLGNEKMADIVRDMMKQQHKSMFIALRDGQFDALLDPGAEVSQQTKALSADAAKRAVEGARPPAASQPILTPTPQPPVASSPALAGTAPLPQPDATGAKGTTPRFDTPTTVTRVPELRPSTPPAQAEEGPRTERNPGGELTLDIDALERAAAAAAAESGSAMFKPASELPPPPANLFREKTATGHYRTLPPRPASDAPKQAPAAPPAAAAPPPAKAPPSPAPSPKPAQRYGNARPASIFGQARPQQGKTIFGEDLISDKSLDEVILSYLADDFEPPKKK